MAMSTMTTPNLYDRNERAKTKVTAPHLSSVTLNQTNTQQDLLKVTSTVVKTYVFFEKYTKNIIRNKSIRKEDLTPVLERVRESLLRKNVAASIAEQVCADTCASLIGKQVDMLESLNKKINAVIRNSLARILSHAESFDLLMQIRAAKAKKIPYTITFVGVNGVGKSTSLSKVASWLLSNGFTVLIAACDTFRAGAVEQLRTHCQRLDVPLYERGYEKDPAKIAQEAILQARHQGIDVVLIDTAGRMQDNEPLMRALSNLVSLNSPDLVLFVGEALVGNDAVDQLQKFDSSLVNLDRRGKKRIIDGIVVSKFDTIDDKVGAILSMVFASGAPVLFIGCGQSYQDLQTPNIENLIDTLLS
ncbi:signal recognition particle receptor protein [Ostreococcus tauri]|uniref:Signal recognition particle receptor protein n=1 Tax=Ostreococcus tauri TaxID=70448 RepID=A0A1Y5I5U1_OSTTA|nr:signal recognition particle receptor protein [Ostreococcus tauri]